MLNYHPADLVQLLRGVFVFLWLIPEEEQQIKQVLDFGLEEIDCLLVFHRFFHRVVLAPERPLLYLLVSASACLVHLVHVYADVVELMVVGSVALLAKGLVLGEASFALKI